MSGQIRMSPQQMRVRAKEFRTEGENIQNTITKMQKLIDTLQGEWEGEASKQFAQQFATLKPSFTKMKQLVDDIGKQLDGTANATEQLDRDIASKFKM